MEDYQLRVISEKEELDEKLNKLNKFFLTDLFLSMSEDEKNLMFDQAFHMDSYSNILQQRVDAF